QISSSFAPASWKLGMPVMLIPFLITQNNCDGARPATSLRSGGSGCSPSEYFSQATPGAPWQFAQPWAAYAFAPAWTVCAALMLAGGWSVACRLIDAVRAWISAQRTIPGSSAVPATL